MLIRNSERWAVKSKGEFKCQEETERDHLVEVVGQEEVWEEEWAVLEAGED